MTPKKPNAPDKNKDHTEDDEQIIVLTESKTNLTAVTEAALANIASKNPDKTVPLMRAAVLDDEDDEPLLLLQPKKKPTPAPASNAPSPIALLAGEEKDMLLDRETAEQELFRSLMDSEDVPWKAEESKAKAEKNISVLQARIEENPENASKYMGRETAEFPYVLADAEELLPKPNDDVPFTSPPKQTKSTSQEISIGTLAPGATREDERLSDEVLLEGLLIELNRYCSRACCFLLRGGLILGYDAKGQGQVSHHIRDVLFPVDAPSVFSQVVQSRDPYHGPLPHTAMDQIVAACLGNELPRHVAIFPILQADQVVALYYLDDAGEKDLTQDLNVVEQLMIRAALLEYRWQPPDLEQIFKNISQS